MIARKVARNRSPAISAIIRTPHALRSSTAARSTIAAESPPVESGSAGSRPRRAASINIRRAIDAELYFYARVWGIALPEALPEVPIDNLEQA